MDAITAMLTRKSVRKFTQDPVKDEDLRTILDCGRLAPSGVNRQAWRFIVLKSQEMKEKVAAVCDYGHFIDQAPVVIAVASEDARIACPNEDTAAAIPIAVSRLINAVATVAETQKRNQSTSPVFQPENSPATHCLTSFITLFVTLPLPPAV